MHCPSMMTAVPLSEGFVPFVQKLENSSWCCYYMFYVRKCILNVSNYHLDRCFPEIVGASYEDKFADLTGPDDFTKLPSGVFWWLINIRPGYLLFRQGNSCTISLICQAVLLDNSAMTNYMSVTPMPNSPSAGICLKVLGHGIIVWLEGQKLFSACLTRRLTVTLALASVLGTP